MINTKNYILIIVPYLTLCCGLYQLTYWMQFNLNAFDLISIQDIVTSSIMPLILSFVASSIGFYIATRLYPKRGYFLEEENATLPQKKNVLRLVFLLLVLVGLIVAVFNLIPGENYKAYAMTVGLILYSITDVDFVFAKDFNPKLDKKFLLMMMIYFPFISAAEAFTDAYRIIENKSYQFIKVPQAISANADSDTLKLIGIANERFIFINIKNEKIYFIKSDTIVLYKK